MVWVTEGGRDKNRKAKADNRVERMMCGALRMACVHVLVCVCVCLYVERITPSPVKQRYEGTLVRGTDNQFKQHTHIHTHIKKEGRILRRQPCTQSQHTHEKKKTRTALSKLRRGGKEKKGSLSSPLPFIRPVRPITLSFKE